MSETMKQAMKPPPASVLIARPFERVGLPINSSEVLLNIQAQERDEKKFWNKSISAGAKQGEEVPEPCCKTLHISLCFDGTNNHEPSDSIADPICTSNVARLFHASLGQVPEAVDKGFFAYYSPGVGTVFEEVKEYLPNSNGLISARGGEARINWGLTRLIAALKETLRDEGQEPLSLGQTQALVEAMGTNLAVSVFSDVLKNSAGKRKAAIQPYEDQLASLLEQRRSAEKKPEILALRLYVYGFSRGAAQARAFANWLMELTRQKNGESSEYRFAGLPISIEFLGLFDTVAAVGLADSVPFAAGHMDWASGTMRLPDESEQACLPTGLPEDCSFLKRCVHLVSAHEQRASFPLDSIRRREKNADGTRNDKAASTYRKDHWWEYVYPGMHSDVGGGYPPGDQGKARGGQGELMSQIPLHHMYRSAFAAGAPLQVPKSVAEGLEEWRTMSGDTLDEFAVSDVLIGRFNAWQKQAVAGSLEDVIKREQALITAWRIDRYAGGIDKQGFYRDVQGQDMSKEQQAALKRLHAHKLAENSAAAEGKELPVLSEREQQQHEADLKLVGGSEAYTRINANKTFEPALDDRQLRTAAAEFKRDYTRSWGVLEDTFKGGIINLLLGGTVYLMNEEDEAQEYAELYKNGTELNEKLFVRGVIANGQQALVELFDEQVHDSRAWFMNSATGEREPFTDYFRYRLVHFDNESNKSLSVLATAGRVVGVGIALASVGLSVKKRNPRYLIGLFLPSLATPVLTGRPGLPAFPEIKAFDPLTGIALPMMDGVQSLRAFTQNPGDVVAKLSSMPLPIPLTEQTAITPDLQTIFKAAEAAKAAKAAKDSGDISGLLGQAMDLVGKDDPKPGLPPPGWLDQAKGMAKELTG